MGLIGRLRKLKRFGQASTEMAVFGSILLIVLAGVLKYGQLMSRQQELQMNTFRKALTKIDEAYDEGVGRVSYSTLQDIRLVDVFSKHYNGDQRSRLSASSSIFWDNDIYSAERDAKGKFFYRINDEEVEIDLTEADDDESITVDEVETASVIQMHGARDNIYFDGSGASRYSWQNSATETITSTLKIVKQDEDGDIIGYLPDKEIAQTEEISEYSVWFTPGE